MSLTPRIRAAAPIALALVITAVTVAAARTPAPNAPRTPKTVEIKMVTQNGMQMFEPKEVTIQEGDIIKWVAVSGSHNVSFWADSIPTGAEALLRKAMAPDTLPASDPRYFTLTTPRKPTVGDSIVISFAGMPKGVYKYNCRPHLMRGMVAQITVQ